MSDKKLTRKEGKILGVCAGLGDYLDIDPTVIRLGFLLLVFGLGTGVLLYLILAVVMPKDY
ncbi:MAG: PspC domain-containing protein [Flavobacteriales bacterium]|jgi:phage shock protein C|nr:PspC domain-containing protein [Flavobacteriales bacterium]